EIVAFRLAVKVAIDDARHKQPFAFGPLFQLVVNGPDMLGDEGAILLSRTTPLLELPLPFEEGRFVHIGEDFVERDLFDDARTVERRRRNWHIRAHVGADARIRAFSSARRTDARRAPSSPLAQFRLFGERDLFRLARLLLFVLSRVAV